MKSIRIIFISVFLTLHAFVFGQNEVTLNMCYTKARDKYPLTKQLNLLDLTKDYTLDNISKGYLPQLSIQGQATYQSDVTALPIKLPGVSVPSLPQDQYKAYIELQQGITSNYTISKQKDVFDVSTDIEKQKIEVELYKLHERINDVFFGIILLNSQLDLLDLLEKDITSGISKVKAAIANGVAFKSSEDILQAELLSVTQRRIELTTKRNGLILVLDNFTGLGLTDKTIFTTPDPKEPIAITKVTRPEIAVFDKQTILLDAQLQLLHSQQIPKLGLFFQTGYGSPALNMFSTSFDYYYIGGIRFTWNIANLYTYSHDKQLLSVQRDMVDVQRKNFMFQTEIIGTQQYMEIQKIKGFIDTDKQIIYLRTGVAENAKAQLENGAITTNDYINYVNARDKAAQNLAIHTIQLLQEEYKLSYLIGY